MFYQILIFSEQDAARDEIQIACVSNIIRAEEVENMEGIEEGEDLY